MKKAIDWFALLVGVALALYGARWMWTGWDIVQAERGWTAVIAGSVMLSGGLIVATLAWAIMRIANAPAAQRRAVVEEEAAKPSARPAIAMPATVAVGAAAAAGAGMSILREKPEAEPVSSQVPLHDAPLDNAPLEDPPIPPPGPPTVGELLRMSEERVARESHDKIFEEPEAAPPPPPQPEVVETAWIDEPPPPPPPVEIAAPAPVDPPLPPPVALEPEPPAPEPEPEPEPEPPAPEPLRLPEAAPPVAPAAATEEPVFDDWLERTAREFDRELGRDNVRDIAPKDEPAPEPPPPPKPEPAVVGRYSSGDTNYLMFADGSIEAQTPEGIMRFASLTELKRFVEKRN